MTTYPARRVLGSSADWKELNEIQTLLCFAINPCCLFLGAPWELDLEPCDISSIVDRLETALDERRVIDLRLGDCLDLFPTLAPQSIDAVIADIPYGTTACKWDTVIPFEPMWEQLKRIAKPKAAIVLFGSQPFTSALVMSNIEWFKYCWVWDKVSKGDIMNAKNKPLKQHEDICIFSDGTTANKSLRKMHYYPQGILANRREPNRQNRHEGAFKGLRPSHSQIYKRQGTNYPASIIRISNANHTAIVHPTQKPVALMEYLIRTYTNEGDTVLDFTMGSGTTMVACVNTKRNGIGFEILPEYFEIAKKRIAEAQQQMVLL